MYIYIYDYNLYLYYCELSYVLDAFYTFNKIQFTKSEYQ